MATANMYAMSLRHENRAPEKTSDGSGTHFVSHLAKVKTNIVCQANNKHLLFSYEQRALDSNAASAPLSPTSAALPYRKQGNQSHYTDENLRKRQRLLSDRRVLAGIARFWDTFPRIRQGQSELTQRDYVDVFMKFYKALVAPHEFSIGEARKIVERDWGRDVGSVESMTKPLFFRALFEVADIWTVGISVDEYSAFLCKLYDRVTMKVPDHTTSSSSLWVTVFADLDRVRSFGESTDRNVDPDDVVAAEETNQDHERKLLTSSMEAFVAYAPSASSGSNTNAGTSAGSVNNDSTSSPSTAAVMTSVSFKTKGKSGPAVASSGSKARPPLLRKKTLSSSSGLSDSVSTGIASATSTPAGSLCRLPEIAPSLSSSSSDALVSLSATAAFSNDVEDAPTRFSGATAITKDSSINAITRSSSSDRTSDRTSDAKLRAPSLKLLTEKSESSGGSNNSSTGAGDSAGPLATYRSSRVQRNGSLKGDALVSGSNSSPTRRAPIDDPTLKDAGSNTARGGGASVSAPTTSASSSTELPPQPIRLAMPSIYLSPDLTESQATYRAARRRIRESSKLAQRLRRITF